MSNHKKEKKIRISLDQKIHLEQVIFSSHIYLFFDTKLQHMGQWAQAKIISQGAQAKAFPKGWIEKKPFFVS